MFFFQTNIIYSAFSLAHQLRLFMVLLPLRRDLRAWSSTELRAPISGPPLHLEQNGEKRWKHRDFSWVMRVMVNQDTDIVIF
jgi:hypothetical protein